jgi:hypothetical protein
LCHAGDVVYYVVTLSVYGVSNNFIAMRNSPSTAMADKSAQVIKHGNVEKNTFAQGGIIDFQHRGKAFYPCHGAHVALNKKVIISISNSCLSRCLCDENIMLRASIPLYEAPGSSIKKSHSSHVTDRELT